MIMLNGFACEHGGRAEVATPQKGAADGQPRGKEIFIVDDDPAVRDILSEVFHEAGYQVTSFVDGASFTIAAKARIPACVILDIYLPGRSGLEILKDIDAPNYPAPIFIASGRGDIPSAVEAIKSGAFDFIEKRMVADALVARVHEAIEACAQRRQDGDPRRAHPRFPGSELLTRREHEVLAQIAASATNKEAARALGISQRTVEIHRAHIMQKLGAKNSIDLARKVLGAGTARPVGAPSLGR
jgi:two-component system, LuxR family, response regulator FixJ